MVVVEAAADMTAVEGSKKKPRAGMNVAYLRTHLISSDEAYVLLAAAEEARAAKKTKGKGKAPQVDIEDPTKDPTFIQSHTDQN